MSHFTTSWLPAYGLGHRDPRRPHVTGGLGDGIPVYVSVVLEGRIYVDEARRMLTTDRALLSATRNMILGAERRYVDGGRSQERLMRLLDTLDRHMIALSRSMVSRDRSLSSGERDLN